MTVPEADPPPGPAGPPELDPERFTRPRHHREPAGRKVVHRVRELLGVDATKELREATARAERLRQPVTTLRRLAVLSSRGGAGKTAVATLLATTLAASRHDRVVAVDAAPDLGSLALRAGAASPSRSPPSAGPTPRCAASPTPNATSGAATVGSGCSPAATAPATGWTCRPTRRPSPPCRATSPCW